jgi:hypothetical protein
LWTAGEPVRAQIVATLRPGEVEVLVRLLDRVARALNPESAPVSGPTIVHSHEEEV